VVVLEPGGTIETPQSNVIAAKGEMMTSPSFYGILIGIDNYAPNRLPDGEFYPALHGCVRDVKLVETFFHRRLTYTNKHIHRLIAAHDGEKTPLTSSDQLPTYENMVAAFEQVSRQGRAGDQVWIYYAGHGGRTPTCYPQAKGVHGYDEALVPCNIGDEKARYLRDVEIGYLLKTMVEQGLLVTIVLDCCHAGGATRAARDNSDIAIRSIETIDTTVRPTDSAVASAQQLSAYWQALTRKGTRGFEISSGWLPEVEGYVLLAACRDFERAREQRQSEGQHNGVFTSCLLEAMWQMPSQSTYRMLYHRVRAQVHSRFAQQTPQLEGEYDRIVFGAGYLQGNAAITVLDVQKGEAGAVPRILLDAGQMHALHEGAQFQIYSNPVRTQSGNEQPLALVEIDELGPAVSRAIVHSGTTGVIEPGDQAVLLTAGPAHLRRGIRILPPLANTDNAHELVEAINREGGAFLHLVHSNEAADFLLTLDGDLSYQVQDADGQAIANLRPALSQASPGAIDILVQRLVHLARYRNVLALENPGAPASLMGQLHVSLRRPSEEEQRLRHKSEAGASLVLEPGEKVELLLQNTSWSPLHVAILDLAQDWRIVQLYPPHDTCVITAQQGPVTIALEAKLEPGYQEGTDTLKVFAGLHPSSFDWLSLPPLDQPESQVRGYEPRNALEQLLLTYHTNATRQRGFSVIEKEWIALNIEVYIRRK
jgi:hypothetical protein